MVTSLWGPTDGVTVLCFVSVCVPCVVCCKCMCCLCYVKQSFALYKCSCILKTVYVYTHLQNMFSGVPWK